MINSAIMRLNSFLSGGIFRPSLFAVDGDVVSTFDTATITSGVFDIVMNFFVNGIIKIIYTICSFVMALIDLMQYVISAMLGIDVSIDDYVLIDYNNPLIKIISSEAFSKAFKAIIGIAIIFIILFTIFAIIKSEYNYAANSGPFVSKARIFGRTLRSFFIMGIFPVMFLFVVVLVNAILAGFNDILKTDNKNTTIGGQIFISSAYQANNYRQYAEANNRIPISINFDDPISLGTDVTYTTEQLRQIYASFEEKGKNLYENFADLDFGSFSDTIIYKNNKVINQSSYSGYESFVCTREQYYVMADFVDYAVKSNLNYYVKNMTDADIDWGYVDETVYNKDEGTLTITYRDTEYLNNGESYTIVYAPETQDVSSPISDAIKTVYALLGIGEYSDNVFNILNRVEDTINVVEWGTKKAELKFSQNFTTFNEAAASTVETDKILVYEAHKYKYNNTLHYTLGELNEGVELPVYKLEKRKYQASTASYVTYEECFVVEINNTLYVVEENKENSYTENGYVDYYYTLVEPLSTTDLTENTVDDFTTYTKDTADAWGEIIREKTNATIKTEIPAEEIIGDDNDGVYEPDLGETFKDINANGFWDDAYEVYTIYDDLLTESIKQISWPQKLVNDLQVIYADININQLITTNKWLEELGDYHSANDNDYELNNINTAFVHPLGLIMSEFFLGEVSEADNSNAYGTLMFNSKFDEETINALLLSIMGEANYFQLKAELEYFCEIFNVYMGPVLDEIAYYENFELQSGNNASVQLYTYKAYLASMLLSASTAQWMYDTASSLIGNTKFNEDVIISNITNSNYGSYKKFTELTEEYQNKITEMYTAYKDELEEQDILETDYDYPEYMDALYQYMFGGNDAFDGRLDKVLTSYKSSLGREYDTIKEYYKIKNAYEALVKEIDNENYEKETDILALLNKILIEPTVSYKAVDSNGTEYSYDTNNNIFDAPSIADIIRFDIEGSSDEFVSTKTATATRNLLDRIDDMKDLFGNLRNYFSDDDKFNTFKGICDDYLNKYYNAITSYVYTKLEYLEDDNSSQLVGQRKQLENKLDDYRSVIRDMLNVVFEGYEDNFIYKGELSSSAAKKLISVLKIKSISMATELMKKLSKLDSVADWIDGTECLSNFTISATTIKDAFDELFDSGDWNDFKNDLGLLFGKSIEVNVYVGNGINSFSDNQINIYIPPTTPALIEYYNAVKTIDKLDRYNITFGVSTLYTFNTETTLDVVVNNKAYSVGENFTKAKFIEYIFGAKYLESKGYETVFVDDSYNGLVSLTASGELTGSFVTLQEFLVELGDISSTVAQMTNFVNLTTNAYDEIKIGSQTGYTTNLSKYILEMIIDNEYLADDLICALFGVEMSGITYDATSSKYRYDGVEYTTKEGAENARYQAVKDDAETKIGSDADRILNNVLSYLLLTDTNPMKANYVDYTELTLKELRFKALEGLINYQKQEGESVKQNEQRYLAVFALACSDWKDESGVGAINNSWKAERKGNINGLTVHKQSQATLLRLAGLENRPYTELVGAEYTINFYETKAADEANGDVFIICTYDDTRQVYVPFLMGNTELYAFDPAKGYTEINNKVTNQTWQQDYGYYETYTGYYLNEKLYPVVAKGVITSDGKPTAIRKNGEDIEYYRKDVVIHNVSKMELSIYYISTDQITVHHTAVSYVANMFSKAFTGKSLVENLISKIPKFAATTDYKFCYGTADTIVDVSDNGRVVANYNFNSNFSIAMENLYKLKDINLIVLLIGTYTLFIAIWKALWAVMQRIFDVAVLYLLGPAAISTVALRGDSADKDGNVIESNSDAYSKWKQTLTTKLLSVFSLSVGFNIFFVIQPIISNVNLFANQAEYDSLLTYSSIFKNIDYTFINEIGRLVLTAAAAYLTTRATDLFAQVLKVTNAFKEGSNTLNNVKNSINEVGDHLSGQYALDQVDKSIETTKNLIPGAVFMDKAEGAIKEGSAKIAGKNAEINLRNMGASSDEAKNAGKMMEAKIKELNKTKEARKKTRKKQRDARDKARKGK